MRALLGESGQPDNVLSCFSSADHQCSQLFQRALRLAIEIMRLQCAGQKMQNVVLGGVWTGYPASVAGLCRLDHHPSSGSQKTP